MKTLFILLSFFEVDKVKPILLNRPRRWEEVHFTFIDGIDPRGAIVTLDLEPLEVVDNFGNDHLEVDTGKVPK